MDIEQIKKVAQSIWSDYKNQANVTMRWLQDFRKEVQAYKEYCGREIFELLQNADDARSESVEIRMDNMHHTLAILNRGRHTIPFSEDGIKSILLSDLSPKKGKKLIGSKGLGFRSVLNWSNSVEIRSGGVSLRFGNEIVQNKWHELRQFISDASKYEKEAILEGRNVPLAILAIPDITPLTCSDPLETSIILNYEQSHEDDILADLHNFQPESLLFLHHIKNITIIVNNNSIKEYSISVIKKEGLVHEVELNGNHWIMSYEHDVRFETNETYEVACAFCLNQPCDSYCIYNFFPTQIEFPFPCIFHASLELDSSRNSLLPYNDNNNFMMYKLAKQAFIMAEYLKRHGRHDWYPYLLMKPNMSSMQRNEYINLLISAISNLSSKGRYIPTVDGGFVDESGYYYYSDSFYELMDNEVGRETFPQQRLIKAPVYISLNRLDPDIKGNIELYAKKISHNITALAEFIKVLLECDTIKPLNCNILIDSNENIIDGTAYINTGMEVENIPEFRKIKYVNANLISKLKELLALGGREPDRDLVSMLKNITDVLATDVSAVTRNLLPKYSDAGLEIEQKHELIRCLFSLFIKRGKLVVLNDDDASKGEVVPYLLSESNEWLPANDMVFVDERFPNGFANLCIDYTYPPNECVQYPEYLSDIEDADSGSIQQFYLSLGVNLYFKKKRKPYGDDNDYIHALNLSDEVAHNCSSSRVGKAKNVASVGISTFFNQLSLTEILTIVQQSGYIEDVCGEQQISWFLNRWRDPVRVKMSYAAYLLRKLECIKQLKYYVIEENAWLVGFEPSPTPSFTHDYREKILLEALGAKKNIVEFTETELYEAVSNVEKLYGEESSYPRIQEIYHVLSQALDSKGASFASYGNKPLRLLCRINNSFEFRDSTGIYYSDNNELPDNVISCLPMLVMKRREGEQKIKRIFGCKTLKDIKVKIHRREINDSLTKELNRRMEMRKPYLLAFASRGVGKRGANVSVTYSDDVKRLLMSFVITVVSDINYLYATEGETLLDDKDISMQTGQLLCADKNFYICSHETVLDEAMSDPRFNYAVVEAMCIKLNLSGNDVSDRFYRIFTSNEKELEYYRKQEIEPSLWNECKGQFGLTDEDLVFWEKVFEVNGHIFDKVTLREKKLLYLCDELHIEHERLTSPFDFRLYHVQRLSEYRQKYFTRYSDFIYNKIVGNKNLHKDYIQYQNKYLKDNEWLDGILEKNDNVYRIVLNYESLIFDEMKARFGYDSTYTEVVKHEKRMDYLEGIDEYYLSDEDRSLLFFDGYKEYFEKLRTKRAKEDEDFSRDDSEETFRIMEGMLLNSVASQQHKQYKMTRKGGGKNNAISDRRKVKLGYEAEDKVYKAFLQSDEYEITAVFSSHLSKTNGGDDSLGYDLEYRKKGEVMSRCLEIKHYDGESIILTDNEYAMSQSAECVGRYDLALVTGNEIRIVRDAFSDSSKYWKKANNYTVYFKVDKLL